MGWKMPWYTMADSFDKDFGVDEWHGTMYSSATTAKSLHLLHQQSRRRGHGTTWSCLDLTPLGTSRDVGGLARRVTPDRAGWWNWHDNYDAEASP
jgi:predicted dithiol-disulfide oxidoreductase (DUF899 family)